MKSDIKPLNPTYELNRRFLSSLLAISLIIGFTEYLVMSILDLVQKSGVALYPIDEAVLDAFLLTLISAPLLWFLVMRRLVVSINREQEKVAEQTRQHNELRTALDAHALVSIADKHGKIVYANEKFSQVSGYLPEELLGRDHRIVNSSVHDKSFFRGLWQAIIQGETWQGTICNRNKNGGLYWVDSTIMPLLDERSMPRQYISICRDITAQKDNESRLRTLKRAVDACNEMIMITDTKGDIQYANPALYQFSGWTEETLVGKRAKIFNSPNNSQQILDMMEQALANGENWTGRLLSRRKGIPPIRIAGQSLPPDPLEFWAEANITPVLNENGSLFGYVQILRDITALVEEERLLQMEKADTSARLEIADTLQRNIPLGERFKTVLGFLFGLNALDLQRKGGIFLKSKNELALDLFVLQGSFSAEFIEKEQQVLFGDCLCGRAAQANELLISEDCFCDPRHEHTFTGMQAHGHFIVPLSSGDDVFGIMFLYTDPYPIRNESRLSMLKQVGELMALAIMREQAQSTMEKARDMAMQASVTKSEFLANVSHEIRTPMNGVLGMIDLLRDTNLTQTQWEFLETAHNSAEALLEILNDILDFSKLEAGKIEVENISFNLATLIEEVSTLLAQRAFSKGLELNCFLPAGLNSRWQGDPMRIRQVITNLIGNAIKFTENGEVSVTLTPESINGNTQSFRFEIRDTGIGIPQHIHERLFQPFAQADTATARRFGGTGLGLSICKSLVNLMGGEIGVHSEVALGSCFWFTLPLTIDHEVSPEIAFDFGSRRILVVDDNATNRMILNHHLNHWGLTVGLVADGQEAMTELAKADTSGQPYDMIILDMHMPVMDGLTLSRNLKKNPQFENIPRILLSSGALIDDKERRELGLIHSLLKPVRQSQLFDVISETFCTGNSKLSAQLLAGSYYPDYQNKKILVAEDNKVNQKVLLGILARFKVTPTVADNGKIALDFLANETYDLIFMDCQMPIMDGYETTVALRILEQERGCVRQPVVALTAHAIVGEREKCIAAGMDDYLSKPINRDQLNTIMTHWLGEPERKDVTVDLNSAEPFNPNQSAAREIWDETTALRHLDNDKELLFDMILMFQEEMSEMIVKLKSAEIQGDLLELANIAHAIKGSVGHFCADVMIQKAASLENSARNNEAIDYPSIVEHLVGELNHLMATLSDYAGIHQNQG